MRKENASNILFCKKTERSVTHTQLVIKGRGDKE